MQIDLSTIDRDSFLIKEGIIGGKKVFLVNPNHLGCVFTQKNKIFRSSSWDEFGNLISAGFPKFKNAGEDEENFPMPKNLIGTEALLKIDGSLLCFSKWNGNTIIRTRGTIDAAASLENGREIGLLKEKYPKLFNFNNYKAETLPYTILTEWTTPSNQIVIKYPEPELTLVGIVDHEKYELATQDFLDSFAKSYGLKRPKRYQFKSLTELFKTVEGWQLEEGEGIVLYSNNGQVLHKIKAQKYLKLHYFKSTCNLNSLLDLFFEWKCPQIADFRTKLETTFDYECLCQADLLIKDIEVALGEVAQKIIQFNSIKYKNRDLNQKDYALKVLEEHKENSSYLFELRGKGELSPKSFRKLLERELKI